MNDNDNHSQHKIKIAGIKKATKSLVKAATSEITFHPNDTQSRVKAKFYRRLDELSHILDRETIFSSESNLIHLAGTPKIIKWLEDPAFSSWFIDEEYVIDTISSLQQDALRVVREVLRSDDASEGDRLKAARLLLELGDQFPGKKSEVRFLDDRVNAMNETETEKEIKKIQGQLNLIGESDE